MMQQWHRRRLRTRSQRGFTLVEMMIVVAVIGILTAIAIPLYSDIQARARIAKVQADTRTLASAAALYQTHMGFVPSALADLTVVATNSLSQTAGPFMPSIPTPPGTAAGWPAAYAYAQNSAAWKKSRAMVQQVTADEMACARQTYEIGYAPDLVVGGLLDVLRLAVNEARLQRAFRSCMTRTGYVRAR